MRCCGCILRPLFVGCMTPDKISSPRIEDLSEVQLVSFLKNLSRSPSIPLIVDESAKTVSYAGRLNPGMAFMVGQAIGRLEKFFGYNGYIDISRRAVRAFGAHEDHVAAGHSLFWRIERGDRGDSLLVHPGILNAYAEQAPTGSSAISLVISIRDNPAPLKDKWPELGIKGDPVEQLSALVRALTLLSEPCAAELKAAASRVAPSVSAPPVVGTRPPAP